MAQGTIEFIRAPVLVIICTGLPPQKDTTDAPGNREMRKSAEALFDFLDGQLLQEYTLVFLQVLITTEVNRDPDSLLPVSVRHSTH